MGFHRWLSTDADDIDHCIGCGVYTPVKQSPDSVVVSYSPLPLWCPAPLPQWAHYLTPAIPAEGETEALACEFCGERVTDLTPPDTFEWECRDQNSRSLT